jgi:hypothetical protein
MSVAGAAGGEASVGVVDAGGSAGTAMVGSGPAGSGLERGCGVGREAVTLVVEAEVVVVMDATDTPVWASARRRLS